MTNDDKDLKLKECPFCNSTDIELMRFDKEEGSMNKIFVKRKGIHSYRVVCHYCEAWGAPNIVERQAIEAWNSRATPQQPSEPLKELDEGELERFLSPMMLKIWFPAEGVNRNGWLTDDDAKHLANAICSKFGQPSEKKALSVEEIEKIIYRNHFKRYNGITPNDAQSHKTLAQAIHSALPARKEVKWPEKMACKCGGVYESWGCSCGSICGNEILDACIAAYEEAMPAQREVRYPEKMDHDHSCEFDCKGCVDSGWNQAIDEFKKLNS